MGCNAEKRKRHETNVMSTDSEYEIVEKPLIGQFVGLGMANETGGLPAERAGAGEDA